MISLIEFGLI